VSPGSKQRHRFIPVESVNTKTRVPQLQEQRDATFKSPAIRLPQRDATLNYKRMRIPCGNVQEEDHCIPMNRRAGRKSAPVPQQQTTTDDGEKPEVNTTPTMEVSPRWNSRSARSTNGTNYYNRRRATSTRRSILQYRAQRNHCAR
jgi:hypothetical protein